MVHCSEHLQVKMYGEKGHTVGHTVTHYSFHDEMFSTLFFILFICFCGFFYLCGEVARVVGEYEGTGR